jgi:hypothetical protein
MKKYLSNFKLCYVIGVLCFTIHAGFIIHYTYFNASLKNTRSFPSPPRYISSPERWHNFLDLNRWDSAHYEKIVLQGYRDPYIPGKPYPTVSWYPGYPLLAKGIYWITGWKATYIFSLLSALCTLIFWLFLWSPRFVNFFGSKILIIASIFILSWPGAFFWFAGMTEPLVGLLMITIIYLWINNSFNGIVAVLSYATSVKQVFVPVMIAVFTLEILRSHPKPTMLLIKSFFALTGFIAFGVYCWIYFGNFFMSSEQTMFFYKQTISLFALIDLKHYANSISTIGGITAFASMFFLLIVALKYFDRWNGWSHVLKFFSQPQKDLPIQLVLWWIALACTTFFVIGDAYSWYPHPHYMSMMRFQTVNVPLILLLAFMFRGMPLWQTIVLLLPVSYIFLFWQQNFTVQYWLWKWIA